jgi:hypothetical protein
VMPARIWKTGRPWKRWNDKAEKKLKIIGI